MKLKFIPIKKRLLFCLMIFTINNSIAQEKVALSIHQDSRLLFTGDDKGNEAGTINLMARFKMQGCQQRFGYMVIFPEFEYAELQIPFKRYSANIGYTINQLTILDNRPEVSGYVNFGFIDRDGMSFTSLGTSLEVAFALDTDHRYKISFVGQYTQRRDFALYNLNTRYQYSGFFGFEVNLN